MQIFLTVVHVIVALILIVFVLLQSGKGGGMGMALGGASAQVFGGRGAGTFLTRLTTGAAIIFFLTSLTLSMLSSQHRSVVAAKPVKPKVEEKATPAPTPAPAPAPQPQTAPTP